MRRPELLIPASSLEVLKIAVIYGADAGSKKDKAEKLQVPMLTEQEAIAKIEK